MNLTLWRKVLTFAALGLMSWLLLQGMSFAGALPHGAKAAGMGTAFIAVADDPSAIMHNPAGLTQTKGTQIYGGGTVIYSPTQFETFSGISEETELQVFFPPHLYASSDFGTENLRFGLGIFSPFGIGGKKWSQEGLTRHISTENAIATVSAQPTLAWKATPWLSVGFGFSYMHAFNTSERMIDQSAFGAGDAKARLEGDGGGWGYNFGILLFPGEKVSLGFVYRSHIEVDQSLKLKIEDIAPALQPLFRGHQFETRAESSLDFPQIVSMGIAYRPTKSWTLAFDAEWLEWSTLDKSKLDLVREVPRAGLSDTIIPFDFENTWFLKAGADYKLNEKLSLRAGYSYSQSPVPDHTLGPGNPDSNQHAFSTGFGYDFGKQFLDASYSLLFYEERTVRNNVFSGSYNTLGHAVSVSFGYRFK